MHVLYDNHIIQINKGSRDTLNQFWLFRFVCVCGGLGFCEESGEVKQGLGGVCGGERRGRLVCGGEASCLRKICGGEAGTDC